MILENCGVCTSGSVDGAWLSRTELEDAIQKAK